MYCTKCGTQISDTSTFCSNCGSQVVKSIKLDGSNMESKESTPFKKSNPKKENGCLKPIIGVGIFIIFFILIQVLNFNSPKSNENMENSKKSCVGFGNQDCISQVRLNLTNSGKQILNESYLGDGVFKITSLDPSRGITFNSTITTDCNCQLINVKISDIE